MYKYHVKPTWLLQTKQDKECRHGQREKGANAQLPARLDERAATRPAWRRNKDVCSTRIGVRQKGNINEQGGQARTAQNENKICSRHALPCPSSLVDYWDAPVACWPQACTTIQSESVPASMPWTGTTHGLPKLLLGASRASFAEQQALEPCAEPAALLLPFSRAACGLVGAAVALRLLRVLRVPGGRRARRLEAAPARGALKVGPPAVVRTAVVRTAAIAARVRSTVVGALVVVAAAVIRALRAGQG